ncbi:tripartite tricarboxylate transporter substrate binding protein [Cupriavidus pauculus]|jgi:tripartite-type tricarboxylate transporter receptor subunit TctC|uniref:Tripartite tricarboxylate transporter substrate binding protein n=1 Tax=Cupriavidus pauculus TaxID=82633 RepID=A0A5P2HDI5_9BURK|nr:tripartite tricarboxylate transporter substrate binding protein [Cupriavidus pauculus]QET05888.1 tripartite tricarboxylate transporter substrate binding protein [Cupriavidus pauculus]
MLHPLTKLVRSLGIAVAFAATANVAVAADWPTKPITIVAPFTPGGTTDIVARAVAAQLQKELGQSVVVDNRPGAGGTLGAAMVARAQPDGYTLLLANVGHAAASALYKNLPYDFEKDMTHITTVAVVPNVLIVRKSLPVNNVKELIAYLKSHPGEATFGSAGIGTTQHLSAELLKKQASFDAVHVPYKGASPMMTDIIGGRVVFALDSAASANAQLAGGNIKALAVTTSQRTRFLPDVPTLSEAGVPGYQMSTWYSLAAPRNLPPAIRDRIYNAVVASMKDPSMQTTLQNMAAEPGGMSPTALTTFVQTETRRWTTIASGFSATD